MPKVRVLVVRVDSQGEDGGASNEMEGGDEEFFFLSFSFVFEKRVWCDRRLGNQSSTSSPGGNLVDSLPPA